MERCETAIDRLSKAIESLAEFIGITVQELDPPATRARLIETPEIEDLGTNIYYPKYQHKCLGTSDDQIDSFMDSSPWNPKPHFESGGRQHADRHAQNAVVDQGASGSHSDPVPVPEAETTLRPLASITGSKEHVTTEIADAPLIDAPLESTSDT